MVFGVNVFIIKYCEHHERGRGLKHGVCPCEHHERGRGLKHGVCPCEHHERGRGLIACLRGGESA